MVKLKQNVSFQSNWLLQQKKYEKALQRKTKKIGGVRRKSGY